MLVKSIFLCLIASANVKAKPETHTPPHDSQCLYQADFQLGTKIISTPGNYKLCEDISFGPFQPVPPAIPDADAFDPPSFSGEYSPNTYGLGFFAAISVRASNVNIFLDGHTIEQSASHALMQRFFAVIELASSPFIESAGPHQFIGDGDLFVPAQNTKILGPGVIGRSSHHSIHGNDNSGITISNIIFRDFEVAAISLNNVDSVDISYCEIRNNRHDVPVLGLFSAARFIRPYGKALKELDFKMQLRGETKTAAEVYDALITSIQNVYSDVIYGSGTIDPILHPEEHHLFHNPFGVVDGPCYAIVVHGKGPAVGGQGDIFNEADDSVCSGDVKLEHNLIKDITCWNNEIPAALDPNHKVMNDVRGSVFQFVKSFKSPESPDKYLAMDADGHYQGNVLADMQIMVASALLDGVIDHSDVGAVQTVVNSIDRAVVDWAKSGSTVYKPFFRCNGDSMHHVIKGIIAVRVEDTRGFFIRDNLIMDVNNLSVEPFGDCHDYHPGCSPENPLEHQAGNIRGISVAAVRGFDQDRASQISNNKITTFNSDHANVIIGIDVQGDSANVDIEGNFVDLNNDVRVEQAGNLRPRKLKASKKGGPQPKVNNDIIAKVSEQFIALRIRKNCDDIRCTDNTLLQKFEPLNESNLRRLKEIHGHMSGDIDWKIGGGCPFAARNRKG